MTLGTSVKAGSSGDNCSKSWQTESFSRFFSTVDSEDDLYRSEPFSWTVKAEGKGVLYIQYDYKENHDWNFKVLYEIEEEGFSPEFQGEDYQVGNYGNPLELEENEFDDLENAYSYAKGIIMSEEIYSEDTLNQLLEK